MKEGLRILIVEDNPADADLVRELLSEPAGAMSVQIESVPRLSNALTRLESQDIDLVLLDLSLPDSRGLQTFHTLRKAAPDIPVIVLTGTDDQELATAAVRDGAQDYLVKGQIGGSLLFRAIRYALARHKAEQELARTAREWQITFDATKDAIWILDENHRVLRTNKMAENYFNRPCSEMIGKPCWEIMHGTAGPIPDCPSVRARKSGNRETMDLQRGERWFEVIVDPISNATGQYAGAVHIVSDITQRKRAEEEMRRQSLVINQTSETIAITDLEGIITDINAAQCRALGRTREELIGKSVVDVYGGTPARNALQREIIETTRTRGQWFGEIANVSATGEAILVECRTWLLRDEQGKAIGMFGVGTDITARKQAEAALRDSRALYYSLVENLPQSIFRKDRAGRFQFVNERFCQDLKRSVVDIIGRTDVDFFPPELALAYRQDDLQVMETGQVLDNEETHVGADGRELAVHVLKTPLRDAQGQIIGIQGVFWDITTRKRAENELRRVNRALRAVSECGQALVHARDEATLLTDVCRLLVEQGGYRMAWVGLAEQDEAKAVRPVAKAGHDAGYLDTVNVTWADTERGRGPVGTSIRNRQPVVIRNILTNPIFEPWRQAAIQRGYAAVTALPLMRDDRVFGALTVYAAKPDVFDAGEMELLTDLASDVAYGITSLRARAERERAEAALRESEEKHRVLIETTATGFVILDAQGRVLDANDEYVRLSGHEKREQILGRSVTEWTAAHDQALNAGEVRKCVASGSVRGLEVDYVHPDGTVVPIEINASTLGAGDDLKIVTLCRDITGRKQAEKSLKESRLMLHSVLDAIPARVFWKDTEGRYLGCNQPFARDAGFDSPEALIGKNDYDMGWKDQAELYRADDRQVITSGVPKLQYEEPQATPAGTQLWLRTSKIPLRDSEGRIVGILGTYEDITERKRAEATVAHERQLLRTLIDLLPETFYIKDLDGRFLVANEALAKQWGKENPSQMLGLSDTDLFPAEQAAQLRAEELKVITGEPVIDHESICAFRDGREHTVVTTKLPFRDSEGRICGLVGIGHDITEHKLATQRIADALNFNQTVLRASPVGIVVFKAAGPCVSASESIGQIIGGSREAVLKQNFRQLESWKQSGMLAAAEAALAAQAERSLDTQIATTFGRKAWITCRFTPFHHENEPHLLLIVTDITERKEAEEALRQSEEKFRNIFTNAPVGIFQSTTDQLLFVNPVMAAMFGYESPAEMLASKASTEAFYVHPEQRHQMIREAMESGTYITRELEERRKDGSLFITSTHIRVIRNETGEIKFVEGFVEDITERKRAEEALRKSETELDAILESTDDGILAVDHTGDKVIKANRRFAELWGIPQSIVDAGDNSAQRNFVLNQLSDPDAFLKRVRELYSTDTVSADTFLFKDGRVIERHGFPMMMDEAVIGRVWSFCDITERKRQERELTEKSAELERFTYTVSHDLKSPLVTVKTFLGYLEQDMLSPDTERVKQDVTYMRTAADKMGQLLDELLKLARIGRKSNPPARVTFQELAREAVALVAGRISTSRAEVQVADAAVVLEGDRPCLVEIWQNLVENACKFMGDQPKPRVEIGVEPRGAETVFFVRDNGAGIDPRHRDKLFSLFEKLNPKMEGTGMGLALVKRVVELYQGRIWVESGGPGQGANFLFTLPTAVIIEMKAST